MTSTTNPERYGDRLFRHSNEGEDKRLGALTRAFHAASTARLTALGVQPGWRCLDVGAGTGVISRWLAGTTAPGQVIALDRDTGLLDTAGLTNITVLQADVVNDTPDLAGFDLVHARFLLMHLREREALLAKLATWLRPGGWLLVSDAADLATPTSTSPALRTTISSLWKMLNDSIGMEINYSRVYPRPLLNAGLTNVDIGVDLPVVRAGSPLAEFLTEHLVGVRSQLLETGLHPDILDDALTYLNAADTIDLTFGMISAWGQRPAEASP
ncbi:class I SAM-dependent methyltransferase [Streptomyces sp. NPDC085540]|uniref:class I SAM-dependent methyltransferase n=1 Tax=Streptomyces sp. NPDC085540 TaxID=3365730 RepID=UPI0037D807EB